MNLFDGFRSEVRKSISKATKVKAEEIVIENPPQPEFGDLSFPCFTLSKQLKKSPDMIATRPVHQMQY